MEIMQLVDVFPGLCHRFFQHRLNLQVFSIKPAVFNMKYLPGFSKHRFFSKKSNLGLIR
jgi:hypothetical protein